MKDYTPEFDTVGGGVRRLWWNPQKKLEPPKLQCECGADLLLVNGWVACEKWCGRLKGGSQAQRDALKNAGRVVEVNRSKQIFKDAM